MGPKPKIWDIFGKKKLTYSTLNISHVNKAVVAVVVVEAKSTLI